MSFTPLLTELIDALRCLPGVGQKSAQRMAFSLLEKNRDGAQRLSRSLASASEGIGQCTRCQMFSEETLCPVCADPGRDDTTLCVVESPADVLALNAATGFRGRYFVLMGHLSPLDGIGPEELGIDKLEVLLRVDALKEVIIATNPTVEGDATAHFVADVAKAFDLQTTRIAHGVPVGGELEYVDGGTLSHAFLGRRAMGVDSF